MDPVIHFEMPVDDTERACTFYERAFDWQTTPLGPEMGNFVLAMTTETDPSTRIPNKRGAINGGFYQREAAQQTIRLTILVQDLQAAIIKVRQAGGTLVTESFEVPGVGLFATFADTEGNLVQLNQDYAVGQIPT
jgi:predicted enzyme related to lactoylglutathione lyase